MIQRALQFQIDCKCKRTKMHTALSLLLPLFYVTYGKACFSQGPFKFGIEQREYVGKHNALRVQLANGLVPNQPRAVNLFYLRYDRNLEQEAYKLSRSCVFQHSQVEDGRWLNVGQNLYKSSDRVSWDHVIQAWFNEHKYYRYPGGFNPRTGHYTQIIWSSTNAVGCAYSRCPGFYLYVCNYGPGGNVIGNKPYITS